MTEMSYEEFQGWQNYFTRRPVGWREDHRASLIMQASGAKIEAEKIFPSLAMIRRGTTASADVLNLKGSAMFQKMMSAVGGDSILDILGEENGS